MFATNNTGKTKSRLCGNTSKLFSDSLEEVGDFLSSVTSAVLKLMGSDLVSNWVGGINFLLLDLSSLGSQITLA